MRKKFKCKLGEDLEISAMIGFNTKQPWIYSDKYDVYIDPPAEVLNNMKHDHHDSDACCEELEKICESKPDWLYETDHWYDGEIEI